MRQPKLLIFVRFYLPGFKAGGPIRSIKNLVDLIDQEFSIRIFTGDRDFLDTESYATVPMDDWVNAEEGIHQIYYTTNAINIQKVSKLIKASDIIYLNSFFDPFYSIVPMIIALIYRKKIVLAPRGEFSEGALHLKALKKRLYLGLFKLFNFKNSVHWHVTNNPELKSIEHALGKLTYYNVANNISFPPKENWGLKPKHKHVDLFFLARIDRKKNLRFALEVLSQVPCETEYSIYGAIDDAVYWQECLSVINSLPSHIQVNYMGAIDHSKTKEIMAQHDVLFLPTLGENFGHSIAESLSEGVPVIISDQTPWVNLEESGAGWELPLESTEEYVRVITQWYNKSDDEFQKLRATTFQYYRDKYQMDNNELLKTYKEIFQVRHA